MGSIRADGKTSPIFVISINNVTEVNKLTFGLYKFN
jgi:hypothetical protein